MSAPLSRFLPQMQITLVLSALASFLLCACNKNSDLAAPAKSSSGQLAIAVIPKGTTHTFWQSIHAGADAAGKEMGCKIIWNGPEREGDRERQIQIIEDFIAQRVDGVVVAPLDSRALVPSVEKLQERNIPCVVIDSGIETERYVAYAATDNYQGGVLAARRMAQSLGGKGKALLMKYAVGSASTTARENGFRETIQKEFPGMSVVDSQYAQDTVETALQTAEDMLTRNRDVQGLFAVNESTTIGSMQAIQSQKRTEIKLIGFDATPALLAAVRSGQIDALVVQNPYRMGYEGVKTIVAAIHHQPFSKRQDTGVALVTQSNLDEPKIKELLRVP
ncbi:MAG: sugar ABC transporter substrate-binding protein [Verrucomicrobia bacterium]|nr:MAG: sugar ABC transporter substrate-binding protein [Verrucomicrobiota bacterium]